MKTVDCCVLFMEKYHHGDQGNNPCLKSAERQLVKSR